MNKKNIVWKIPLVVPPSLKKRVKKFGNQASLQNLVNCPLLFTQIKSCIQISLTQGDVTKQKSDPEDDTCYQFLHCFPPSPLGLNIDRCITTIVDWSMFCREICEVTIERSSQQIGGEGLNVHIDETRVGKRKYQRGHFVKGQWVFGALRKIPDGVFLQLLKTEQKKNTPRLNTKVD